MTDALTNTPAEGSGGRGRRFAWCGANRHFLAAALILAVLAGGWHFSGITVLKKPVPWPKDVEVDPKTFQNTSLAKAFGNRFKLAEDTKLKDDVLGPLKIGTALDRARVGDRRSNWYLCRVYIDTQKEREPFRVWRLNVYYYTGISDQVPHVPERCLEAAGAEITDSSEKTFTVPACRPPWNEPIEFKRTRWKDRDGTNHYVQYYVFSMNDEPMNDRNAVRWDLMWPWVKHTYYAKIEFAPNNPITDIDEADAAAQEFMKAFLPHVINALPTRETVDRLDAAD